MLGGDGWKNDLVLVMGNSGGGMMWWYDQQKAATLAIHQPQQGNGDNAKFVKSVLNDDCIVVELLVAMAFALVEVPMAWAKLDRLEQCNV